MVCILFVIILFAAKQQKQELNIISSENSLILLGVVNTNIY